MEQNKRHGNSNLITREYLDSLLFETRYIDAVCPDPSFELYGKTFKSPIMTAALSHLNRFMFEGAMDAFAEGAKEAGAAFFVGMTEIDEMDHLAGIGDPSSFIEIIKPYKDRDEMFKRLEKAEERGFLAVGTDIDHAFNSIGLEDEVFGIPMAPFTTEELAQIRSATKLPFIVKGVLSVQDARKCLEAGVTGILLSHHNNKFEYAVPPLMALPAIREAVGGKMDIFVDDEIATGLDAFKAICLGAKGVCIGRPLMTAIKNNGAQGVAEYFDKAFKELSGIMAFTGCRNLEAAEPTILHKRAF